MIRTIALSLTASALLAVPAAQAGNGLFSTKNTAPQYAAPSAGYQGQTYVTPDGCSYSRAQAPGYQPTWHLILNGDMAGMTRAHRRCPAMLGSYGSL